jgi:hypothetical protein
MPGFLSELGSPTPHPQGSVAPSPFGSKGGDTLSLAGGRGGGTQFRRTDRHSGTLCIGGGPAALGAGGGPAALGAGGRSAALGARGGPAAFGAGGGPAALGAGGGPAALGAGGGPAALGAGGRPAALGDLVAAPENLLTGQILAC